MRRVIYENYTPHVLVTYLKSDLGYSILSWIVSRKEYKFVFSLRVVDGDYSFVSWCPRPNNHTETPLIVTLLGLLA